MKKLLILFLFSFVYSYGQELQSNTDDHLILLKKGESALRLGDNKKALSYFHLAYTKALSFNKEKSTKNKVLEEVGYISAYLSFVYKKLNLKKKALLYIKLAENNFLKSNKENKQNLISTYLEAANITSDLEDFDDAKLYFEKALKLTEEYKGKSNFFYGNILTSLSLNFYDRTKFEEGIKLNNEALKIISVDIGNNNKYYFKAAKTLADGYYFIGNFEKSEAIYTNCLKILDSVQNYNSINYNISDWYNILISGLSVIQKNQGKYDEAKQKLELLLSIAKNKGGGVFLEISALNGLALIYQELGNFEQAINYRLRSNELFKNKIGINNPEYGTGLFNIGTLFYLNNNDQKAETYFKKSIINAEKTLGKNHSYYSIRLWGLANLYASQNNFTKSIPIQKTALKLTKENQGINSREYFYALVQSSEICITNNISQAINYLEEAVSKKQFKIGNWYNISLIKLSELFLKQNNIAKALEYINKAKKNCSSYYESKHQCTGNILLSQIEYDFYIKNYSNAIKKMESFVNLKWKEIENIFNFSSENESKHFLKFTEFSNYINSKFYNNQKYFIDDLDFLINNILSSKSLLLNNYKHVFESLLSLNNSSINEKIKKLKALKATVLKKRNSKEDHFQLIESLTEKINLSESKLISIYNKKFNDNHKILVDWKKNKNKLSKNEIAIEFTHFKLLNKKSKSDSTMYAAYLYKKDWKTPKVVNLFEEKQLKKYFSISNNPNNLYKTRGTITASNKNQLALADSIYKLVWKPLEKHIKDSDKIYFSPDGLLHKIPFAALPNAENKLISEVYDIHQMGNTADIRTNTKQPNLDDILLIGGVKYDYQIDSTKQKNKYTYSILESEELLGNTINRSISRNGFGYLEGTEIEVKKIDSILNKSQQLTGYEATETAFKKLSGKSPSILHIATHGFFFKKPKEKPETNQLIGQQNNYSQAENPLLRSGLLFANANYAWQNGNNPYEKDDGILTALEISNLDLKNTDIVILSACETGLGDIEGSEGVYGLQRAFKMAGVKTIIMSLWEVPDSETAEFMNLFYSKWKTYNNPKKAFKETQLFMMNKYRKQPNKWAAFVYFE